MLEPIFGAPRLVWALEISACVHCCLLHCLFLIVSLADGESSDGRLSPRIHHTDHIEELHDAWAGCDRTGPKVGRHMQLLVNELSLTAKNNLSNDADWTWSWELTELENRRFWTPFALGLAGTPKFWDGQMIFELSSCMARTLQK